MLESLLLQVSWRKGWEHRIGNCKALALSVGDPEQAMPVFPAKKRAEFLPQSLVSTQEECRMRRCF